MALLLSQQIEETPQRNPMGCEVINLTLLTTDLYLWSAGGERGSGFVAGTVPWAYSLVINVCSTK